MMAVWEGSFPKSFLIDTIYLKGRDGSVVTAGRWTINYLPTSIFWNEIAFWPQSPVFWGAIRSRQENNNLKFTNDGSLGEHFSQIISF